MSDELDSLPHNQRLDADQVRSRLTTTRIGRELHYLRVTNSTMDDARRLAEAGCSHGATVVADEQTAGRGTKGRIWVSPPGQSIHTTLVVRPSTDQMKRLSIITPVAACEAIARTTPLQPTIKWPNDIQIEQRKLGGILIEAEWGHEQPQYALIGIGLNVNFDPAPWASQIDRPATSLMIELAERQQREPVLAELLNAFEAAYDAWDSEELHQSWRSRLSTLGRDVRITGPAGDEFEGRAEDVNRDGALLIRRPDGEVVPVIAGEVTLRDV